eukprot:scaffold59864_cov36-Phaeocystis_antarctica.AAC.1
MIASRAANGMNIVVVWQPTQLTDIAQTKRLTIRSPQQGYRLGSSCVWSEPWVLFPRELCDPA